MEIKLPSGWIARPKLDRKGVELSVDMSELITCKDCIHYRHGTSNFNGKCYKHIYLEPDEDWFCADGKREYAE